MPDHKRTIEIFSAGCPTCEAVIAEVKNAACPSCDVSVLNMHSAPVYQRAQTLGITSVPAVVIDGQLADCCSSRGVDIDVLKSAGLGRPTA